tara:strand:- start:144 stop:392 length:249 start_codon:yes stop_codon:yes gene_type:complete
MYRWSYDEEEITLEEYVRRLAPLVREPVQSMWEFEGDMLMSDFQKFNEAGHRLRSLIEQFESNKPDLKVVANNEEEPHSEGA